MEHPQLSVPLWCHECNSEVTPVGQLMCPHCGGGFVETMESARSLADAQRFLRRHERRQHRLSRRDGPARTRSSQQVLRFLQLMALTPTRSPSRSPRTVDVNHANSRMDAHETMQDGLEGGNRTDGDDPESDSTDGEVGLLDPSDWLSHEDGDEWEGVEADDEAHSPEVSGDSGQAAYTARGYGEQEDEEVETMGARIYSLLAGDHVRQRHLSRRLLHTLHALRELQHYNSEVESEGPHLVGYVGNPGDYADARRFEELLEHFMETDSGCRGAPPASKSAVEGLPTVFITQKNVDNGSALCTICKEVLAFDEPAKQLPCLHLYHSTCILPWLSERNSCPVCRYELPTDNPDYEEHKKSNSFHQAQVGSSTHSSGAFRDVVCEGPGTEGGGNGEHVQTESMELCAAPLKEEAESGIVASRPSNGERGFLFEAVAGPLLKVVGLVVVSCLGSFLLGSRSMNQSNPSRLGNQVGRIKEVATSRPWWTRLFG